MLQNNRLLIFQLVFMLTVCAYAQKTARTTNSNDGSEIVLTPEKLDNLKENEERLKGWVDDMMTPGVKIEGDSMLFSNEARRLISDAAYRKSVYKKAYTFEDVKNSLLKVDLQKAFWQMIIMYPDNKETVLQYIYAYDEQLPTDKLVTASFYTYAFFDPEITTIENNRPNIRRPDVFEEYFRRTKEIVTYINYFRNQKAAKSVPKN
jgi:hypothetical protein